MRERTATESLLSIVLVLEAALVFFMTLVVFGLRIVEPVVAFSAGVSVIAILVILSRLQRFGWARWCGWPLQAALVATGIILSTMYVIGAGFAALWIYCWVRGRALDRAKAAMIAETTNNPGAPRS